MTNERETSIRQLLLCRKKDGNPTQSTTRTTAASPPEAEQQVQVHEPEPEPEPQPQPMRQAAKPAAVATTCTCMYVHYSTLCRSPPQEHQVEGMPQRSRQLAHPSEADVGHSPHSLSRGSSAAASRVAGDSPRRSGSTSPQLHVRAKGQLETQRKADVERSTATRTRGELAAALAASQRSADERREASGGLPIVRQLLSAMRQLLVRPTNELQLLPPNVHALTKPMLDVPAMKRGVLLLVRQLIVRLSVHRAVEAAAVQAAAVPELIMYDVPIAWGEDVYAGQTVTFDLLEMSDGLFSTVGRGRRQDSSGYRTSRCVQAGDRHMFHVVPSTDDPRAYARAAVAVKAFLLR